MTFALDLERLVQKYKARADDVVALTVTKIAAELDKRSPVGDAKFWKSEPPAGYIGGHFRANWQLGVNVVPRSEKPGVDRNGTVALPAIVANIPDQAAGNVYYLANNVPYARRLEYGWSRQAPSGLVGLTATKFQQRVREAVAEAGQ